MHAYIVVSLLTGARTETRPDDHPPEAAQKQQERRGPLNLRIHVALDLVDAYASSIQVTWARDRPGAVSCRSATRSSSVSSTTSRVTMQTWRAWIDGSMTG